MPYSSQLRQLDLPGALSQWQLPEVIRSTLDSSLWHSGVSLLLRSVPDSLTALAPPSASSDPEVRAFLCELLDYFTHLGNFPAVADSRLVLAVAAEQDAYVPRSGVASLTQLYPQAEVRLLPQSGHVGAYLRNAVWTKDFR